MDKEYSNEEFISLVFAKIKNKVGSDIYQTWFSSVGAALDEDDKCFFLLFHSKFGMSYVRDNHGSTVTAAVCEIFGNKLDVAYKHDPNATSLVSTVHSAKEQRLFGDPQADFFTPSLADVPGKDEVHLMEIAPFALSTRDSGTSLVYDKLPDLTIEITSNEKHGLMTYTDYSFVLMYVSHLNELAQKWRSEMAEWRKSGEVGSMPEKPPRKFKPLVSDFERFTGKRFGGKQYEGIEPMLDRLKSTHAKIRRTGRSYKRTGTFSFIGDYEITIRSPEKQHAIEVEIEIPAWIYDGVVRETVPTLKTYHPGYLEISSSLAGFLYRLAKIKAGQGSFDIPLHEVHHRSGSRQQLKEFNKTLKKVLERIEKGEVRMPEYCFDIKGPARARYLSMTYMPDDADSMYVQRASIA